MKKILSYCLTAVLLLCAMSCHRKARIIPRKTMIQIYADCFLLDQQIERQKLNRLADTTYVYGAILDKYGYTVDDYWISQAKYIRDANRYSRMLKKSAAILEAQKKELQVQKRKQDEQENAEEYRKRFSPNRVYLMDTLDYGHIMDFDIQDGLDTVWRGPLMVVASDSLEVQKDSLLVDGDTVLDENAEI